VSAARRGQLACGGELLERVLADRLEHAETQRAVRPRAAAEQAGVDKGAQRRQEIGGIRQRRPTDGPSSP
jgi:hypothetical protein